MEPLSPFSSVSAVTELSVTVISLCFQYSKDVKNARAEIEQLRRAVNNLQRILESVEDLRGSPDNAKLKDTRRLVDAIDDGQLLLQRLNEDLSPKGPRKIMRKFGFRALKWPLQSKDVERMVSDLRQCIETISMGLQVDQTNILLDIDQKAVLDRLPVANGAPFDSFDEARKPKCLPNTRVDLLNEISKWADDPDSRAVFWLNGMAGTGKSTISRTVAQSLATSNRIGASFFFKRGETDRGGLLKFFTTIAADLAVRQPAIASHLKQAIDADPSLLGKSAREQFEGLILGPLSNISQDSGMRSPIIFVIDALDECEPDNDVKVLIRLFSQTQNLVSPRVKAFLTSRPELPPRIGFGEINGKYQDLILHEVPESVIEKDIWTFFVDELSIIRREFNSSVAGNRKLPDGWPGDNNIQALVKMAVPLFIFASTTCRFIADRNCGSPKRQLKEVLRYQTRAQESQLDATYLPVLNRQIADLSRPRKAVVVEEFRAIVGSIVILANPLSIVALSHILDVSQDIVADRLDMLHSVLSVPPSAETPVRLLHLSFRDFLLHPETRDKTELWVDEKKTHENMAAHCLRVLNNLKSDLCGIKAPGTPRSDINRKTIDSCLPPELQYACLYWVNHLQQSGTKLIDGGQVHEFLLLHFLHWLEALSLMERARESISLIKALQSLLKPQSSIELSKFLNDAKRFTLAHVSVIESWPLQIYYSALIFTPEESVVRINFKDDIPPWLSLAPQVDQKWGSCLQVLEGHEGSVTSVAFSHDSTLVASASWDTIRVWLTDTGECLQELKGHSSAVASVSFSHDSSLLVSASYDKTIRIWRVDTGDCMRILEGHTDYVRSVAISHDSALIVSGSGDKTVRIWNMSIGNCIHKFRGHTERIRSVAFSHDSTLVASASVDKTVRIWSADDGTCKHVLRHSSRVHSVAFSHDSILVVSSASDTIRTWRVDTGNCDREFGNRAFQFYSTAFSPDSAFIAASRSDRTIQMWRTDTGDCVQTFKGHTDSVWSVVFSHDSTRIASASGDETVRIWDTISDDDTARKPKSRKQSASATTLNIQRADTGGHTEFIRSVIFSHDSTLIASTAWFDKTIRIWRADTGRCIQQLDSPYGVESIAFSHDSSLLAGVARNKIDISKAITVIRIWKVDTGVCIHEFDYNVKITSSLKFSHNLNLFALGYADGTVRVWRVDTGDCIHTLTGHEGHIFCVAFSNNSTLVASGSDDKTVRIWDVETGNCIHELKGHHDGVQSITFSDDSALVASGSIYEGIRIWRVDTGNCIQTLKHQNDIRSMAFTHDSSLLASSQRGIISIWRTATGELMQSINVGHQSFPRLEFETDQHRLLTDVGYFDIDSNQHNSISVTGIYRRSGYGISLDKRWITWGENNLLRLPQEYEPECSDVREFTIVLGDRTGRVVVLGFSARVFPDF